MTKKHAVPEVRVSGLEAAEFLGCTSAWISQLKNNGVIPSPGDDGKYDLRTLVRAYVDHATANPKREVDVALKQAKLRDFEARTKLRLGEVVKLGDAENVIRQLFYYARNEISGLGRFMVRDVNEMNQYNEYVDRVMDGAERKMDMCLDRLRRGHKDPTGMIFRGGAVYGPGGFLGPGTKHKGAYDYDDE